MTKTKTKMECQADQIKRILGILRDEQMDDALAALRKCIAARLHADERPISHKIYLSFLARDLFDDIEKLKGKKK